MPRSSLALALLASLAPACAKPHLPKPPPTPKPFSTSIAGEGGPPIRDTPVGTAGTSTLYMHSLMTVCARVLDTAACLRVLTQAPCALRFRRSTR
jgi:hypothetical protein